MIYVILFAVFVALLVGLARAASTRDRYADMTEEEFQADADRSSLLGAAMLGLQKNLQQKRVEYILQRDKHLETDATTPGDRPPEGPPEAPKK